jgi:hypothetical protein
MECAECGGTIEEGQAYSRIAIFDRDHVEADVAYLGSMSCFIQYVTRSVEHYLQHLAERN